jgi:hypothetical protein
MRRVMGIGVVLALLVTPAMASFFDNFDSYTNGELVGQDGWTGTTGIAAVQNDGTLKLTYDDTKKPSVEGTGHVINNFTPVTGPVITWSVDVYAGGNTGQEGNAFDIQLNDAAGLNFARWYGGYNSDTPRIDGFGQVLPGVTLVANQWNSLKVVIDTVAKTSTFYHNNNNLGSLAYATNQPAIGAAATQVTIGLQNASTSKNGAYKFYDNLSVTPEPATLGLLALGALFVSRRRARA